MCGLLGIATRRGELSSNLKERFPCALESLRHRGPNGQGTFEDGHVLLGHTRLSILDLSAAGSQPMLSTDGRFVITYNGELYNFRELAAENHLEGLRSHSDTEVLLRLFAQLGIDSFSKLNGMFAFAVYDTRMKKVWLVRDRLGIKPLYYRLDEKHLVFSSEMKSILALRAGTPVCEISALHEWLYYGNPLGGKTLYAGIKQLLPGHVLELDLNSFRHEVHAYWSLKNHVSEVDAAPMSDRLAIADTRRLLEQAVRRQLVSDVPVGVFLSGGIDSSAIVAFASRHYDKRLLTYSAGFDFARGAGELPKARRIAAHFGTEHHELHISGENVGDVIEKLVRHHDAPFSDAANIPLYLMASKVSGHTRVVLQGDGGDELFGGYRRYSTMTHYRLLRALAHAVLPLSGLGPKGPLRYRMERYLRAFAAENVATAMALLLTPEDRSLPPSAIFAEPLRRNIESYDPFVRHRECQREFGTQDAGNQMSFIDLLITLPDTFLEKVDRSTMAASLEVRVPFLDNDLVDFVARLPARSKIPNGHKKWLLKSALAGIVPGEVLHGPKIGLEVPFGKWLQGPLRPLFFDHLSSFTQHYPGVLDVAHVNKLMTRSTTSRRDETSLLWKVLNFMIWANATKVDIQNGVVI